MKILVTGAYGQLGNELKVLSTDYPEWQFLFTDADTLDITNDFSVKTFFDRNKPDFVINCAAYTAVDKAETDIETAEKVNVLAPEILAKTAAETGAKLIHVSTDYVFDGTSHLPYSETSAVNPVSVYGKTKLTGETLALAANSQTIVIRTSWLYSSFGNNFVKTMLRLGHERGLLNVVFDQVGTPTYAADLASVILFIIAAAEAKPEDFIPGVYHYSNEGVASWYDFAKTIFELSEMNVRVNPVRSDQFPTVAKRPAFSVLDKTKIKTTFCAEIPYWKDSLEICLRKLKEL
jgi:dTDP-4-dehydrorhamnose reductase